jgi:hypothetical protein
MSFTYTAGGADIISKARFLLGDTVNTTQQPAELADEEINGLNALFPDSIFMLASNLCSALAAKYASSVQTSAAGISSAQQQRHAQWMAMAEHYRLLAKTGGAAFPTVSPFAGGTIDDTGRAPIFDVGMDDYPGSSLPPELLNNPFDQGEGA